MSDSKDTTSCHSQGDESGHPPLACFSSCQVPSDNEALATRCIATACEDNGITHCHVTTHSSLASQVHSDELSHGCIPAGEAPPNLSNTQSTSPRSSAHEQLHYLNHAEYNSVDEQIPECTNRPSSQWGNLSDTTSHEEQTASTSTMKQVLPYGQVGKTDPLSSGISPPDEQLLSDASSQLKNNQTSSSYSRGNSEQRSSFTSSPSSFLFNQAPTTQKRSEPPSLSRSILSYPVSNPGPSTNLVRGIFESLHTASIC